MRRNHLARNPILGMAALALAIGVFILTVTGSLRGAFDLALSQQGATVLSVTVRPQSTDLVSQEAIIGKLGRVEGVQSVTATFRGSFKPEEERHSSITRIPDTIQGTWSDLPGLEFPPPDPGTGLLSGRLPWSVLLALSGAEGPALPALPALSEVEGSEVEGSEAEGSNVEGSVLLALPALSEAEGSEVEGSGAEGPANINGGPSNEAVIGYELAQRLGKKVGDTLVVNEHPLVIVGIWQPSILSPGNVVQVPYDTIRQWLPRSERSFEEMTVILEPGYDAEAVARRIWDKVPQVEVLSPARERAERRQAMLALDLVVLYSILLTVLVGGATTLNATLMATHELSAISHPLSAKDAILLTVQPFLAALAGGLGGLLAGWLAALGLNAYTVHNQARTLFIVMPQLAGEIFFWCVLVGLAAGIWPALWAQIRSRPESFNAQDKPLRRACPARPACPERSRREPRRRACPARPERSRREPRRRTKGLTVGLAVLGVALVIPGVMLIGSLVESFYCSLNEGQRAAADRIRLESTSSQVAYYEPLADALRRWPGILGIAVEAYGGALVEDEERWIGPFPASGIVYGFYSDREDFGLDVPYRVGLWQGRVFQPGSLDETVIGYDLAARQGLRVGDTLNIQDHDFKVVGIRQRLVYGCMNDFNLRAEVSLGALRRVLGRPYAFGTITAFIPPAEREEDRELFLARLVERFSGTAVFTVKDRLAEIARDFPGVERLVVESSDDTLFRARLLYFGLLAGGTIPLLGLAGLGVISALRLTLAESRQEIQLRKLFGASDGDVLARWLERAAVWGGVGGLVGMGLGWLAIEAVNLGLFWSSETGTPVAAKVPPSLTLVVTPRLVVMTAVVAVLLGVIAGLGPAWQAARLSPLWED